MPSGFAEPLRQADRTHVLWRGRKLVYFGGCDYLRLSFDPRVIRAAQTAIKTHGLNVAASRRTTGNHPLYEELEAATSRFFGAGRAVLLSTGYLANIAAAQGLRGAIDRVFIDARAHASLRDAVAFLGCGVTRFAHRDARDLEAKARQFKNKRCAILTDGMFAHDGSIAPLPSYRKVCGPDALLWVDDAHAAGVVGRQGRGTVELAGLSRRNVLQTITFSKGFGVYGGAILCERARGAQIVSQSSVLAGNTPLPLPLAAAARAALEICRRESSRRARLWRNVGLFWEKIGRRPEALSPIISILANDPRALKRRLIRAGIHPPLIEYGGGPEYFRFALSSEHSAEQIKRLARVLAASPKAGASNGLLFLGLDV